MMEWVAPVTIVQKRRSGGERERKGHVAKYEGEVGLKECKGT